MGAMGLGLTLKGHRFSGKGLNHGVLQATLAVTKWGVSILKYIGFVFRV